MSISDITDRLKGACVGIVDFLCSPVGLLFIASEIAISVNGCQSDKTNSTENETDKPIPNQTTSVKIESKKSPFMTIHQKNVIQHSI